VWPEAIGKEVLTMSLVIGDEQIRMISSTLDKAESALHDEVDQLSEQVTEVTGVTGQLDATLKDLLNMGTSSLDAEAQILLTGLSDTLNELEAKLKPDLEQAEYALTSVTQETHNRIGELVGQIEDSVVDAGVRFKPTADHMLDRAAWNTLTIGAGLLLLLGLIVAVALVIASKGWPGGIGGLIAVFLLLLFVLLAGALTFVPAAKELALKFVRREAPSYIIPPTPEIFNVDPNPVRLGTYEPLPEINIHGVHLAPHGASPVVTIDGTAMEIHGAGDHQITVALPVEAPSWNAGEPPPDSAPRRRTRQMTLTYPDRTTVGFPLPFEWIQESPVPEPAEIVITPDPAFGLGSPVATRDIVHPKATIQNVGGTPSKPFQLTWVPEPGGVQITATVPSIPPGASLHTYAFFPNGYTYRTSGTFETELHSNSREMDPTTPAMWQAEVEVQPALAPPAPDPVLVAAQAVFRTWDDDKRQGKVVNVGIWDVPPEENPNDQAQDLAAWLAWIQQHRALDGQDAGEFYPEGSTVHLALGLSTDFAGRPVTKSKLQQYLVRVAFSGEPAKDEWHFDLSLRLAFSDDSEPKMIDFGSGVLSPDRPNLERYFMPFEL
jgi:ElaB/YqjD/DUF883 family membrane-anchored ribosome-binding protein